MSKHGGLEIVISVSQIRFIPAGQRRIEHAEELAFERLGKHLPLRELTTDDGRTCNVYLVGPVVEGGPDERLAAADALVYAVLAPASRDETARLLSRTTWTFRGIRIVISRSASASISVWEPRSRASRGRIALETLIRRAPNLKLNASLPMMRWRRGLVLRGMESLPVKFSPGADRPA